MSVLFFLNEANRLNECKNPKILGRRTGMDGGEQIQNHVQTRRNQIIVCVYNVVDIKSGSYSQSLRSLSLH